MNKKGRKFFIIWALLGIFFCSCFALGACKNDQSTVEDPLTFELNIHIKEMSLYDTFKLEVSGCEGVTWTSDNPSVASVDENGTIVATGFGQTTVKATKGDYSDACIVTVVDEGKVPEIVTSVDGSSFSLLEGDTLDLSCKVNFNNKYFEDGVFTYTVSDPTVASVDDFGVITAHKLGETSITISGSWRDFEQAYLQKELVLSVVSNLSMSLSSNASVIYSRNETVDGVSYSNICTLSWELICEGEDVTQEADIQWVVERPEVLSVNENGRVTGLQVGESQIYYTYTYNGETYVSESITLSVKAPIKSLGEKISIYKIGTGEGFTISNMQGQVFAVRSDYRDYSDVVDVLDGVITFDEQVEKDLVGVEEKLYIDTTEYTYTQNVLFVTHAISTKDELTAFLTSYSGKSTAETNKSAEYYAVLVNDIDCENSVVVSRTNNGDYFLGTFDGMGYAIMNYKVNNTGGLFGAISGSGLIKNVALINAVGTTIGSPLLLGQTYGGRVQNIYLKGSYIDKNAYRGMFYGGGLGIASNCIVEIAYPADATNTTNAFTGATGGGLADNMYAIGNAMQVEPKSETIKPYATVQEFLSKKISYIIPENGWSEYWEINDFGVYFGGRLILKNEIDGENTSTLIKAQYAYAGGAYEKKESFTISLSALLNEAQPSAVFINGQSVQMPENGVLTLSFKDYTFGERNEIVITVNGGNLIQPFVCVTHAISTKDELTAFLTSYSGKNTAETNKSAEYYAVLVNDIDCENSVVVSRTNNGDYFSGTFDGMGYAIKNYKVNNKGGLFGAIYGSGLIKNVALINAVGTTMESPLLLGQTYGGRVQNIYVKGSYIDTNAYRGLFYGGGLGIASNCIVDIDYPTETTKTTYVFTGATGGGLASSMYGIGNATWLEPKTETKPYATIVDMLDANRDNIVSEKGWSEYWRFDESGNLYFGDEKITD